MRVAIVTMATPHRRDTPAVHRLHRVARGLAARDHDPVVLCVKWWEGDHETFQQEGIEYHAVTEGYSAGTFAAKLPFVLRKIDPDVIHAINSPPSAVRAANAAAPFLRVPVVIDWWCDRGGDNDTAYESAVQGAEAIVTPSRFVKTMVREHGAISESIHVIPDGIDFETIRETEPHPIADLVYSRRLDRHANVESFLLALAELRDHEWSAAVIGDGPGRADAERTAADLRIDDRVRFLGSQTYEDRVAVLKGAHVFAQTAEFDPSGAELRLGLACGCVGIAEYQTASAAHELIEGKSRLEGTHGSLVTSPQEFAEAVVGAAKMERRTINEAYERYDHDEILDRYLECYREAETAGGLF